MNALCVVVWFLLASAYASVDYHTRNYNTVKSIYYYTTYPNQLAIVGGGAAALPPGLFSAQASGRITPIGNFTTLTESIEYFYVLAPNPNTNSAGVGLGTAVFTTFICGCPEIAATSVYWPIIVLDQSNAMFGQTIGYMQQSGYWIFDSNGAVLSYDLTIPNLGAVVSDYLGGDQSDPQVQFASIEEICGGTMQSCVGDNQQYDSIQTCIAHLSSIPYGSYDAAWSDSVVCRSIHIILATVDPDVHCPHVGPTGGMKCVDYPLANKAVLDNRQLFGSSQPFLCPQSPVHRIDPTPAPSKQATAAPK